MHFILGTIILALFILAIRVIWHTLKSARLWFSQHWALWQSARLRQASAMPALLPGRFTAQNSLPATDWGTLSQTVRQGILERNNRPTYRLEALDIELQFKQKTQAILLAEIEIAKLQRSLAETQALLAKPAKKRRNNQTGAPAKRPNPATQLRKALGSDKGDPRSAVH
ncbi:hypothetical protein A1507_17635 [Methylomonas koyamae]|uniref:Uncharacterized protein n=2 Tax=Methylomonas koyamae TaxID=702114 RepID=A0A177N7S4_9GAMM|nr:hypothetical protein A1507_17635 [Methylomonas koyamae]